MRKRRESESSSIGRAVRGATLNVVGMEGRKWEMQEAWAERAAGVVL